jgi:hypothetical protein
MPADQRRYRSFFADDAPSTESQYLGVVAKYSVDGTGSRIGAALVRCPGFSQTGVHRQGAVERWDEENTWSV